MKSFVLFVLAVLMFSGCSVTYPPVTKYRLSIEMPKNDLGESKCQNKTLKISEVFGSNALTTLRMNYALGENKEFSYSQSQWATPVNDEVSGDLLELIRGTHLFKNVQIAKSRSKTDWLLETNIEDFMQYFNEDSTDSFANVVISLTLIDASNNSAIATKTFTAKVPAKTLDAQGGVEALNSGLFDVLTQSRAWFGEVCK